MIGTYLNGIFYLLEGLVRLLPSLQQILCYATELWVGNFDLIQYLLDDHVELWSLNPNLLTIVVFLQPSLRIRRDRKQGCQR